MGSKPSGTQTVVQQQTPPAPWEAQQPYLRYGYEQAQNLYNAPGPQYFPGSTVVPQSPQTQQALGMQEQRALAGSPLQQAGQQQMLNTIQGQYVGANPYLGQLA